MDNSPFIQQTDNHQDACQSKDRVFHVCAHLKRKFLKSVKNQKKISTQTGSNITLLSVGINKPKSVRLKVRAGLDSANRPASRCASLIQEKVSSSSKVTDRQTQLVAKSLGESRFFRFRIHPRSCRCLRQRGVSLREHPR